MAFYLRSAVCFCLFHVFFTRCQLDRAFFRNFQSQKFKIFRRLSILSGILFPFKVPERCVLNVKGVKDHIGDFNSESRGRHFWLFALQQGERAWERDWKNNAAQIWGITCTQIWKMKVAYAEVEIFLLFTLLYDSAAESASPLGPAASLAIRLLVRGSIEVTKVLHGACFSCIKV